MRRYHGKGLIDNYVPLPSSYLLYRPPAGRFSGNPGDASPGALYSRLPGKRPAGGGARGPGGSDPCRPAGAGRSRRPGDPARQPEGGCPADRPGGGGSVPPAGGRPGADP